MSRTTRDSETRIQEVREEYNMDYISPFTLPSGVKKDGYSYRWVNTGIKGEANFRVEEMAAKGWILVPADRAPGYSFDPLERNTLSRKYISYKDVILMERPDIYCKKATQAFNELNANKIKSLRGVSNDLGGFSSPLTSINSF